MHIGAHDTVALTWINSLPHLILCLVNLMFFKLAISLSPCLGAMFRSVTIGLSSLDIYTTVNGILASCDLSTAVIEQYKQENAEKEGEFPRPVEWHQSYYAYTGKKNPKDNVQRKQGRPEITLRYFQ